MPKQPKQSRIGLLKHPLAKHALIIVCLLAVLGLATHALLLLGTRHNALRTVPDLTGIPLDEARALARHEKLELVINDSLFVPTYEGGVVLDQLPHEGVGVKPGRTVYVTINSFRQKMVPVPYVAGRSLRQAKNMLEVAGLGIERLVYRPDLATNYVLEQHVGGKKMTPQSRIEAEMRSGVTLYVGESGAVTAVVPKTVGLTLDQARSRLWEQGLNVGRITYDEGIELLDRKNARVARQTPQTGTPVRLGTETSLHLTLDRKQIEERSSEADRQMEAAADRLRRDREAEADSLLRSRLDSLAARPERSSEAEPVFDDGLFADDRDTDEFFD